MIERMVLSMAKTAESVPVKKRHGRSSEEEQGTVICSSVAFRILCVLSVIHSFLLYLQFKGFFNLFKGDADFYRIGKLY